MGATSPYRVRCSGLPLLRHCAGSLMMQSVLPPEPNSPEQDTGDAAHELGAIILQHFAASGVQYEPTQWLGHPMSNGVTVDDEMCEAVAVYVYHVFEIVGDEWKFLHVEESIACTEIHDECGGSYDAIFYDAYRNVLHCWDYKHGHKYVDEFENDQGVGYMRGYIKRYNLNDQQLKFNFHIVQPRCYQASGSIRTWTGIGHELRNFANQLAFQAGKALQPGVECVSGPHCVNCDARGICPAAQKSAYHAMQYSTAAIPEVTTPDAAGLELVYIMRAEKALEARRTALETQVSQHIGDGKVVPHWQRVNATGRRKWVLDDAQIIDTGKLMGVDLSRTQAVPLGEAKQRGLPAEVIQQLSEVPIKGTKLKAVTNRDFKRVFNNG